MNFGTEGLHMCTIGHSHLQVKLLKFFQKYRQNMTVSAKDERKEKGILEIIHYDVCGPMSSSSLSGYVYYVSFIDDFSRKTWI